MRRSCLSLVFGTGVAALLGLLAVPACSSSPTSSFGNGDGGGGGNKSSGGATGGATGIATIGGSTVGALSGGASSTATTMGGGTTTETVCPPGLSCNVSCGSGTTTTITGRVYDPAGKDPLYDVQVYVPATALTPLPKGVPTGTAACSCGALFPSGAVVATKTDVNGNFTLTNAPVGASVPLVLQIGKWRRSLTINVTACGANAQADKSLTLPSSIPAGDTDDNMPDIAVSTGSADTLECLLRRVGVDASEYVAGNSTAGHVHMFAGGDPNGGGYGHGGQVGEPEERKLAGTPTSFDATNGLWATSAQLMPYDVVLLSCEGGETYNANPAAFEDYLNAGGRAFASHYHYAWFSGPLSTSGTNHYSAPSDWSNLASWSADEGGGGNEIGPVGGVIDLTLNGSTAPFSKGVTLDTWLDASGALGGPVASTELPIYEPRYNASVKTTNTQSQPWITAANNVASPTLYFSFDTPVNATTPPGQTSPAYCGRAVFSDLHVAGNPKTTDNTNAAPPQSCADVDLSPQEKALEFMLFDLSSCVLADTVTVSTDAGLPPPPPTVK